MSTSVNADREREELLGLLASMGVKLPASTKLPLHALDERLGKALDCAFTSLTRGKDEIKLKSLTPWKKSQSLSEAMRSMSIEELVVGDFDSTPYGELRHMIANSIAFLYEQQRESQFFIEDPARNRSITMTVIGIHMVTDEIPLMAVEYKRGKVEDDDEEGAKMINSPEAHTLVVKLLELNATHLPQQSRDASLPILSFLLPLGPLSMKDIGSLTKDVGCIVCGAASTSKCSGCQLVSYCGKVCQRADWKRHRPACRSLDSGSWLTFTYMSGFTTLINRTSRSSDMPQGRHSSSAPNIHGMDAFIVKVQIAGLGGPSMLIYDRQRSFDATYMRASDPAGFQRLENVVKTGYIGQKVYLWAKRVGEQQLSICLDRKPDQSGISW
ncbi:hypothetical protein DFH11DRAFT_493727 [Phellopilus nigrolimitatus]|nr:hypothetical protein DFH11DRAFT_493727 [Phellopilus nigrolimitatus]